MRVGRIRDNEERNRRAHQQRDVSHGRDRSQQRAHRFVIVKGRYARERPQGIPGRGGKLQQVQEHRHQRDGAGRRGPPSCARCERQRRGPEAPDDGKEVRRDPCQACGRERRGGRGSEPLHRAPVGEEHDQDDGRGPGSVHAGRSRDHQMPGHGPRNDEVHKAVFDFAGRLAGHVDRRARERQHHDRVEKAERHGPDERGDQRAAQGFLYERRHHRGQL